MSGNLLVTHTLDSDILHQAVNGTFRKPRNFFFHLCSRYLPSYLMSFFHSFLSKGHHLYVIHTFFLTRFLVCLKPVYFAVPTVENMHPQWRALDWIEHGNGYIE